jgi:hypothetical protein
LSQPLYFEDIYNGASIQMETWVGPIVPGEGQGAPWMAPWINSVGSYTDLMEGLVDDDDPEMLSIRQDTEEEDPCVAWYGGQLQLMGADWAMWRLEITFPDESQDLYYGVNAEADASASWDATPAPSGHRIMYGENSVGGQTVYLPFNPLRDSWEGYGFTQAWDGDWDTRLVDEESVGTVRDDSWAKLGDFSAYPAAPGIYTLEATWQDNDLLANSDSPSYPVHLTDPDTHDEQVVKVQTTVVLYAVDRIEVYAEGSWQTVSDTTTDIVYSSEFTFRAIPKPAGYTWQAGEPQWSGPETGDTGAQTTVEFTGQWIGTNALTAAVGAYNSKSATFRTSSFQHLHYRRSGEGELFYQSDGGGVNGSVLADASFDYRLLFMDVDTHPPDPPDNVQFTVGFDPLALRGEIWDTDWPNDLIASGLGKSLSRTLQSNALELGSTRLLYYVDENWDGEPDSVWPSEWVRDAEFENEEKRVITRTAKYPDHPDTQDAPQKIAAGIAGANDVLVGRTNEYEYRALVDFVLSGSPSTYPVDEEETPLDCLNEDHRDALFANVDANIICVRRARPYYWGIKWGSKIIIDLDAVGHYYAHEFGHNMGLNDIELTDDWSRKLLMYHLLDPAPFPNTYYCREADANEFQYAF